MSSRQKLRDPQVIHDRRWATLLVLCLSLMVIGLDNTVLNVALPTLAEPTDAGGLGASGSDLQWIVDSYTLVFAGLLLTAGSLGDRFGRYRMLVIGMLVFLAGSVASALAPSAGVLIATRALLGIGAALIMPSTLSILTNVFREPTERGKAIGIWAGIAAVGVGLGPLTGGALLAHFWWGSVFLINVPILLAALALGYRYVPESKDPTEARFDPLGSVLSIVGLGTMLWAVIEGPELGWTALPVIGAFVVGAGLLAGFLWWENRTQEPMLELAFFRNPRFSAATGALGLTFFALLGIVFVLTLYQQSVLGYSPLKAGAMLVPHAAVIMVFAPLAPRLVERVGSKYVIAAGLFLVAATLASMTALTADSPEVAVIAVTVLFGLGMAHVMAPATESIMGSLPPAKAGVGSAMNDTTRQVGGAIGVAVLGSILSSRYSAEIGGSLDASVPAEIRDAAASSIGEAHGAVRDMAGAAPFVDDIIAAADSAFVGGMRATALAAAGVMVVAGCAVLRWLPSRAIEAPAVESEGEGEGEGDPAGQIAGSASSSA